MAVKELDEGTFMREGMIAIRQLSWQQERDTSAIVGKIADLMHNGLDLFDGLRPMVKRELIDLKGEHPEVSSMLKECMAWAEG